MGRARIPSLWGWIILIVIVGCSMSAQGKYGGGSGTMEDPYQIWDANHMQAIGTDANDWDKCFKLIADVNLAQYTGTEFNVIGKFFDPFIGIFDGNNHAVHNFSWSAPDYVRGIGLFGVVGVVEDDGQIRGEIRNLHIVNVDVNIPSCRFIGALVGFNNGRIHNCSSSGKVLVGQIGGDIVGERTGGLVGYNDYGIIENCYSDVIVSGTYDIGGLVGINHRGVIRSSCSLCQVTGDGPIGGLSGDNCGIIDKCSSGGIVSGNWGVGGLIGHNNPYIDIGVIKNSFSYAEVYGTEQVGGLVGYNSGHSELREDIINCYAVGNVSGNINVGGLAGYNDHAKIVNCYSAGIVDGNDFVGGLVGDYDGGSYITCFWDIDVNPDVNGIGNASDPNVVGRTTVEMKQRSTFEDWDFINVWDIGENQTYPYLRRYLAGDVNKDGIVNFLDFAIIAEKWMEEE